MMMMLMVVMERRMIVMVVVVVIKMMVSHLVISLRKFYSNQSYSHHQIDDL